MSCRSGAFDILTLLLLLFVRCGTALELLCLLPCCHLMHLQERVLRLLHQVLLTPVAVVILYCVEKVYIIITISRGHRLVLSAFIPSHELISCSAMAVDG